MLCGTYGLIEFFWSAWESLRGVLSSGPALASWGFNRLDLFVRGAYKRRRRIRIS